VVALLADAFALAGDRLAVSFSPAVASVLEQLLQAWSFLAVPLLRGAVTLCMVMSVIVLAEKFFLGSVSAAANVFRRRRRQPGTVTGVRGGVHQAVPILRDEEAGGGAAAFPMVLVQIPMYNEREVRTHA
jgi:beta-mannan synthase